MEQRNHRRQAVELGLRQHVLSGKQRLLGLEQGDLVDRTLAQPGLGNIERPLRTRHHVALQPHAQGGLLHCDQRPLHVGKTVNDGLAVKLQQLVLPPDLEIEQALKPEAIEDRLRQAGRDIVKS